MQLGLPRLKTTQLVTSHWETVCVQAIPREEDVDQALIVLPEVTSQFRAKKAITVVPSVSLLKQYVFPVLFCNKLIRNSFTFPTCLYAIYVSILGLDVVSGPCDPGYFCAREASRSDPTDGITADICPQGRFCCE